MPIDVAAVERTPIGRRKSRASVREACKARAANRKAVKSNPVPQVCAHARSDRRRAVVNSLADLDAVQAGFRARARRVPPVRAGDGQRILGCVVLSDARTKRDAFPRGNWGA